VWKWEKCLQVSVGKYRRIRHCEGADLDGNIILKWILRVIAWDGWGIFGSEQFLRDSEGDRDVRSLKL
jgi:hypothetical protein